MVQSSQHFNSRNPISKSRVSETIKRFEESGNIGNRRKPERPEFATDSGKSLEIIKEFIENPHR